MSNQTTNGKPATLSHNCWLTENIHALLAILVLIFTFVLFGYVLTGGYGFDKRSNVRAEVKEQVENIINQKIADSKDKIPDAKALAKDAAQEAAEIATKSGDLDGIKDIVLYILGALTTVASQVLSYYFGSSSSADKNRLINGMQQEDRANK